MTATNKLYSNTPVNSLVFSDTTALRKSDSEQSDPVAELLAWIQNTGILSSLSYSVSSESKKNSNLIRFSLADNHQSFYPILRSLLSMGTRFSFRSDIKAKAFTVEIGRDQFQTFKEHLSHIVDLLKIEINFKKALKRILAFEKEIARHQAALQNALHSSMTTN